MAPLSYTCDCISKPMPACRLPQCLLTNTLSTVYNTSKPPCQHSRPFYFPRLLFSQALVCSLCNSARLSRPAILLSLAGIPGHDQSVSLCLLWSGLFRMPLDIFSLLFTVKTFSLSHMMGQSCWHFLSCACSCTELPWDHCMVLPLTNLPWG